MAARKAREDSPRRWGDARGAVSILIALAFAALLGSAAVGVDLGWLYFKSRQLQGMADLAALSAAQDLGDAQDAAQATVAVNAWRGPVTTQAVTGTYVPDPGTAPADRFQPTGVAPSAVKVTLSAQAPLFFGAMIVGRSSVTLVRSATAARAELASFSIGSGLASLQGGVANSLLSALTGSQVQLSVMDYNALLSAHVDLFQYLGALRTRAGLQAGSYAGLLAAQVATPTSLQALGDALTASGQPQAAAVARQLATAAQGLGPAPLSSLFGLGPYANQDHVDLAASAGISLQAMGLADAVLAAAQGGRQVSLDLGAALPGVADARLWLAIGQRPSQSPWLQVTDSDQLVVRTAQMRLYLDLGLSAPAPLSAIVGPNLVDVPLYVEAASAAAKLADLDCASDPAQDAVDLSVSPSLGELALGQVDVSALNDFTRPETVTPATLLNLLLVQATASSQIDLGGLDWQSVHFTESDIQAGTVKTVVANDIAQASVASLFGGARVQVQLLGLGLVLGQGPAAQGLQSTLAAVAPALDGLVGQIEGLSGVKLGEADVQVDGLRCHSAALVG